MRVDGTRLRPGDRTKLIVDYESAANPAEHVLVFSERRRRLHHLCGNSRGFLRLLYSLLACVVRWHCRRNRIRIVIEDRPKLFAIDDPPESLAASLATQRAAVTERRRAGVPGPNLGDADIAADPITPRS